MYNTLRVLKKLRITGLVRDVSIDIWLGAFIIGRVITAKQLQTFQRYYTSPVAPVQLTIELKLRLTRCNNEKNRRE